MRHSIWVLVSATIGRIASRAGGFSRPRILLGVQGGFEMHSIRGARFYPFLAKEIRKVRETSKPGKRILTANHY